MSILNMNKEEFVNQLNKSLSPASPIDSIEHLHGREDEFDDIEKALSMNGRHVFIYGDRGVGKSSLAATIAHHLQSSDRTPIMVSGSPSDSFSTIISSVLVAGHGSSTLNEKQSTREISLGIKGFFHHKTTSQEKQPRLENHEYSIAEASDSLSLVAQKWPNIIVVVDEFDRISQIEERIKFADLLKHLGDRKIQIHFIFTGIARSLEDLLGAHGSAIRQLHTKELARLSWNGRWDIARQAASSFGLTIPEDVCIRLAQISDGYPYYVHLMMEKILWRAYQHESPVSNIDWDLFRIGIQDAIASINAELKRPYEKVLLQRSDDFEPVLWATANGDSLYTLPAGYWDSYLSVMKQLSHPPMSRATFRKRISKLLTDECGPILEHDPIHKQFVKYKENMLRGYVRMQAEAAGVILHGEELKVPSNTRIHTPARANLGYHGSRPPLGYTKSRI